MSGSPRRRSSKNRPKFFIGYHAPAYMIRGYTPHERFSLKNQPEYTERWLQDLIADNPAILGLGDLVLRDRERSQPRAGRLDLLLQDPDTKRRYELELQLVATDEAHIIRTIEYWDIERKRYRNTNIVRS